MVSHLRADFLSASKRTIVCTHLLTTIHACVDEIMANKKSAASCLQNRMVRQPNSHDPCFHEFKAWCREGESIPTVLKGIVKIALISAKCNSDAGLRRYLPSLVREELRTISGDLVRCRQMFY
jgi:hypothetical protein